MKGAPATARARAREILTADIKETARRHLAEVGAPGLSLRAVARELGMASSAVYRYFPSRDALLTALIVDAFDAVGEVAEKAVADMSQDVVTRWHALTTAIRGWALEHPNDYALVYGSPVPGYRAPDTTVPPATRVTLAMISVVSDGVVSGEIDTAPTSSVPRPVHRDLARIREVAGPAIPDEVLSRMITVWTGLFGAISYELFGHIHRVVQDYDAFFDHHTRRAATYLIHGPDRR